MDSVTEEVLPDRLLPRVAYWIARSFPDLEGRALAVSDATITAENVPSLPIAIVAFAKGVSGQPPSVVKTTATFTDTFIVEFWLKPERYKKKDCSETPFWSYYDYEGIRNKLLGCLKRRLGPIGEKIVYQGMTQEASPFAVVLTFTFTAQFQACFDDCGDEDGDGMPAVVKGGICKPRTEYCPEAITEEKDPCARP